jgi:hypothetical protein
MPCTASTSPPNADRVREHATRDGFPADAVLPVARMIDPTTGGAWACAGTAYGVPAPSMIDLSRLRSLLLALRIMPVIIGAATFERPDGSPRLRRDIRVASGETADHV